MASPVYTYVTVLDEIRLALNMKGADTFISDDEINRFIFANIPETAATWTFQYVEVGVLYKVFTDFSYGLWLYRPRFTGTDDCEYTVNARGSIEVTTGTEANTTFAVTGARVDFANCMVQILHWLASHRAAEVGVSMAGGSLSPQGVQDQLLKMADYWTGIQTLA